MVYRMEREQRMLEREERSGLIYLDLESQSGSSSSTSPSDADPTTNFPSATRIPPYDPSLGYLLVRGGANGLGNPNFLSQLPQLHARSPKFATRGLPGQFSVFHLELKLLADVGLVGFPNAGKSTLLRALTRGRSKTEVAGYAFTTVNPVVGVVRMGVDDKLLGGNLKEDGQLVVEETRDEENAWRQRMENGEFANVVSLKDEGEPEPELFRFTVADNPGLIHESSQNRGLGHSFLRSIERALALAYVVDFSGPDPEGELTTLRQELETYKSGLSHKARVVVLNKADLLGAGGDAADVQEAKEKLKRITEFVETKMVVNTERDGVKAQRVLDVVPISAKYSQNVFKLAQLMKGYVEAERAASCQE
jgi:GTP-binding protein